MDSETQTLLERLEQKEFTRNIGYDSSRNNVVEATASVEFETGAVSSTELDRVERELQELSDSIGGWDFVGLQHDGRTREHIAYFER